MIGKTLAHYRVVEKIGAGGMGEVYRATDSKLGRDVALKVLPEGVASHPERLARFEREAKVVATLNHPNIVTLYSIEEMDGTRFLTMELVEGESLDQLLTPGGLPLTRVLGIAISLAAALAAAHERGVVHRDLKPGNVMMTREERVKVLDFGLAKLAAVQPDLDKTVAATLASPISTVGQVVGTVPYMAPEQLRGEATDARTDVFALGIILHELLTGRRPFSGETSADVSSAILRDDPAPASRARKGLPPALDRIIGRCLEKDPERRIQTMKDLREELELVRRAVEADGSTTSRPAQELDEAPPEAPSIAVLPFVNRSRDEEDEYFTDGLADELISVLAKIRGLQVAARTSSFRFKGRDEDLAVIGEKLGVAACLEGSVRKAGDRLRVAVQLVNVSDGFHLWSETYDRTLDDIFAVQDDIAQSVVKELRKALLGEDPDSKASGEVREQVAMAVRGRGASGKAHRLYLQGSFLVRRLTETDAVRGVDYLKRALQEDPEHALAWASLARGYVSHAGWALLPVDEGVPLAREAAERALSLEPDLVEGLVALGMVQSLFEWDWKGAEQALGRALEIAPDDAEVLTMAGLLALNLGRSEEAIELGRRAVDRDPLSVLGHGLLGRAARGGGQLELAVSAFRQELELSPQGVSARMRLAATLVGLGRLEEALVEAENELADWARACGRAIVLHAMGRRSQADEALRELIDVGSRDAAYQIALVYAFRGEADVFFEWLERSHKQRDSGLSLMKNEPFFRPFHSDARWQPFLRKMGFAD